MISSIDSLTKTIIKVPERKVSGGWYVVRKNTNRILYEAISLEDAIYNNFFNDDVIFINDCDLVEFKSEYL